MALAQKKSSVDETTEESARTMPQRVESVTSTLCAQVSVPLAGGTDRAEVAHRLALTRRTLNVRPTRDWPAERAPTCQ
jgi:hypothetical protein